MNKTSKRLDRPFFILGVVFLVFGCLLAIGSAGSYLRDRSLQSEGVKTAAVINEKTRLGSGSNSSYLLTYSFTDHQEQKRHVQKSVPREIYESAVVKGPIEIAYSANDSSKSLPIGAGMISTPLLVGLTVLGCIFGLIGFALCRSISLNKKDV